jgi:DNA topoisomerase II
MSRKDKTIEQIYRKMSQLEHILARPDTYVGSLEKQTEKLWVWENQKMVCRDVSYVPGLYKIFDEILVNAADNLVRSSSMDSLKVSINENSKSIKIWNNGEGIPIQIHKEHNIYVPELLFGHLLTSDNYDDNEKKITGGRNGYGAKLCNVFSKKFIIRTGCSKTKTVYEQVFENNMGVKNDPIIKTSNSAGDFTEVEFWPDLRKFKMSELEPDTLALFRRRVVDIAGTASRRCKVFLDNERVQMKDFKEYAQLYLASKQGEEISPVVHDKVDERWEIAVSLNNHLEVSGEFQQVSFVNSIATTKGGTHVGHVVDQIVDVVLKKANAKNKGGMDIKPAMVKSHLFIFINCAIENPAFSSQTKEFLTSGVFSYGSKCVLSDSTLKKIEKSGIIELVLEWARMKEQAQLQSKLKSTTANVSRIRGIPKLEDANDAGTKNSDKCTLILTEGDSAKALAIAGLSVIGRDRYGVFPLRGKLLNVRDATFKSTIENKEIQALLQIVGLDPKKQYDSVKGLRYGSIMIMTDQDHDGSHIKGLIINVFDHWWPSLLKIPGFLKEFVTPIVKVSKGNRTIQFFTLTEYEKWRQETPDHREWSMKYYKGLGTSTSQEARDYFKALIQHQLDFVWRGTSDHEKIDMAFNKGRADDRKEWINSFDESTFLDHSVKKISYTEFVDKELVHFSRYDVMRSIPSVVDGFKPGQRKVIFCAFKRPLTSDIKVAQFIGYVSEHSAYHHGEQSLEATIVNMAQNYVGSNNVNLMVPSGQFGTRLQGGKDSASARYIYTRLSSWTRLIFHPSDDPVLKYLTDEGQKIEPTHYVPVIPMVLVNGADGIGTGWSTSVPCFNPIDIINVYRNFLRGDPIIDIVPFYQGFKGKVEKTENGFEFSGSYTILNEGLPERSSGLCMIEINELPVFTWTQNYKEFLQEILESPVVAASKKSKKGEEAKDTKEKKVSPVQLSDIKEYHTETTVNFKLYLTPANLEKAISLGIEKVFKLKSKISTNNMMLFDRTGRIRKYNTAQEILQEFAYYRLETYSKRREHLITKLQEEIFVLKAKKDFILAVLDGRIIFKDRSMDQLVTTLRQLGFKPLKDRESDENIATESNNRSHKDFDYLLGMSLWSLTAEKVDTLKKNLLEKEVVLSKLMETTEEQLWDDDLVRLHQALDARLIAESAKKTTLELNDSKYSLFKPPIVVERKEFVYTKQDWKKSDIKKKDAGPVNEDDVPLIERIKLKAAVLNRDSAKSQQTLDDLFKRLENSDESDNDLQVQPVKAPEIPANHFPKTKRKIESAIVKKRRTVETSDEDSASESEWNDNSSKEEEDSDDMVPKKRNRKKLRIDSD